MSFSKVALKLLKRNIKVQNGITDQTIWSSKIGKMKAVYGKRKNPGLKESECSCPTCGILDKSLDSVPISQKCFKHQ